MPHDCTIELRGLRVGARIGVTDAELAVERELRINLTIESAANRATDSDQIGETIDYAAVAAAVESLVRSAPHRTLERVATRIATAVLERFDAEAVEVKVTKPNPPMSSDLDRVAVRIRVGR